MNANVMKCNTPFVTRKPLKRTPPTEELKERVKFIDSHDFSFTIDEVTGELICRVTEK